jgi:hypothetical protein
MRYTVIIEGLLLYKNFEVIFSFVVPGLPQNPSCIHSMWIYDPFMGETSDQHVNL